MAEIGDTSSFLGLACHNGWQYGKADRRFNSAEVLFTSYKNLVNFGPLTLELTVMVWRPFMRQMGEIGETRSILGTCIRQWIAGTAERICAKFTRKTCLVLRSNEFECQKSKVRATRDKNALCTHNIPAVWTKWNGLVADNVVQAAGAPIRSLQRGVFAGMRALGMAGYGWALTRISSSCCDSYAFFNS